MTQTSKPKPGPRPDRAPSISTGTFSKVSLASVAGEPGTSGVMPAAGAAAGDISVVTVSDAQDRTSAGSLSAVGGVVQQSGPQQGAVQQGEVQQAAAQQAPATAAIPVVTAGPGLVSIDVNASDAE
ncbi:MAG TPA: hypothetical protein VJS86_16655, partial [Arthrobacter sp.]|nr:hypothetical protein [Arthrobacter sp.]